MNKKYHIYIAGPFFNPKQIERIEFVKKLLDSKYLTYYSPKDRIICKPDETKERRKFVFNSNEEAIHKSAFVFAITDEKDMGTIWEAGYAYALNIPIIYFCETLGNNPFNLMLAESAHSVFTSRDDLINCESIFAKTEYKGVIE